MGNITYFRLHLAIVIMLLYAGLWNGIQSSNTVESSQLCPDGWLFFGTKCFKALGVTPFERKSWDDAKNRCLDMNANLVSIHNKEENEFIVRMFPDQGHMVRMWLGLHEDASSPMVYSKWTDDSLIQYSNWGSSQPTGTYQGEKEECGEMFVHYGSSYGKWNDDSCNRPGMYACQIRLDNTCALNPCEHGAVCTQDGAQESFRCSCPVGYTGQTCEEKILCGDNTCENGGTCVQDDTEGIFRCECPNGYQGLTCEKGLWNGIQCSDTTQDPQLCPNGWSFFGIKCYKAFGLTPQERVSWDEANAKCLGMNTTMVSIHSTEEEGFVAQMFPDEGVFARLWLGLHRDPSGVYLKWTDNSQVDYMHWNKGEPSGSFQGRQEECVIMYVHRDPTYPWYRLWNDDVCDLRFMYACQIYLDNTCALNPCGRGNNCTQDGTQGSFRCSCPHGYTGKICEEKILCGDDTCENGGICTQDGTGGIFRCECQHGHEGLMCENKIICDANICENGGNCTQDGTGWVFRCECAHGYQGLMCEQKIVCGDNTCDNGGTCRQDGTDGVFRCECLHGYQGLMCEQKILCSDDKSCGKRGICTQDGADGVIRCECQHGYRGLTCEYKIICDDKTCENGATCTQDGPDGVFRCECLHGYQGLTCEQKILCGHDTCENEGICTQDGAAGVFRCGCQHGYEGLTCEQKILCGHDTCENEGICTQDGTAGVFRCNCQHGYEGLTCEEKILCGHDTCENGGICTQDGVFRCECQHGYEGLRCQQKILCRSNTCLNGGNCMQDGKDGVWKCQCQHGFQGLTCEQKILCGDKTHANGGICSPDGADEVPGASSSTDIKDSPTNGVLSISKLNMSVVKTIYVWQWKLQ